MRFILNFREWLKPKLCVAHPGGSHQDAITSSLTLLVLARFFTPPCQSQSENGAIAGIIGHLPSELQILKRFSDSSICVVV